jgi:hypothetical protein
MGKGSSSAKQTENIYDNRIGAGNDSIIIKDVSNISVTTAGADIVADALDTSAAIATLALSANSDAVDSAIGGMGRTADTAMDAVTDTASEAMANLTGLATGFGEGVFDLGTRLVDVNETLSKQAMTTMADQVQSFNTTLRDTLSSVLSSDNLAGSAAQSGSAEGWIARTPGMAAALALATLAGLVLLTRKK